MTTVFKNCDTSICFNSSYTFMNKTWTYVILLWPNYEPINVLVSTSWTEVKAFHWVFSECSDFPRNFPEFSGFSLIFMNFQSFSLIYHVLTVCCEPCILHKILYYIFDLVVLIILWSEIVSLTVWYFW